MNLRKSVKSMCAEKNRKQKELAAHLGITEVWLCRVLKNPNNTQIKRLVAMAEFFDVPLSEFVGAGE